jgi:glucuronate isomerase
MKKFMDENFLLNSEIARNLYHNVAKNMPIIDYHCHISPKDIAEDTVYGNIAQVWLYGDHYKWRAMRSNGVDEKYITGDSTDYEKFEQWAKTMSKLIGNPLYHWSHLELLRYFDIELILNEENCKQIWELSKEKLKNLSVRKMIEKLNVKIICTTDDPIDSLEFHKKIKEDKNFKTKVYPAFRPDKAINIDSPDFSTYINQLSAISEVNINNLDSLKLAINKRIDFFNQMGCKASDHGLDYIPYIKLDEHDVNAIFIKALSGEKLTGSEIEAYKTSLLLYLAEQYHKNNWIMELHYGVIRNTNSELFKKLGPDTGFDTIGSYSCANNMVNLFNYLEERDCLPKTLIFSVNPTDNAIIGTVLGCFQSPDVACKIQQGSAWWFNDTKRGIQEQLSNFADLSVLGNFVGFLTDSRSFLSYTRHEYFRRILCNMVGDFVENGEYPNDINVLSSLITDISYQNAVRYFDFNK